MKKNDDSYLVYVLDVTKATFFCFSCHKIFTVDSMPPICPYCHDECFPFIEKMIAATSPFRVSPN